MTGTGFWMLPILKYPNATDALRLSKEFNKYIPIQNKAREDWKTSGFKLITLNENAVETEIDNNNFYERPDDSATLWAFCSCLSYFPFCLFEFFKHYCFPCQPKIKRNWYAKGNGQFAPAVNFPAIIRMCLLL
jgi:hypothetical protein